MKEANQFLQDQGFSEEVQTRFSSLGKTLHLKKGEKLLQQGEACTFIAIIVSGLFKIYHEHDGNESSIGLRYQGFLSDYPSFVTQEPAEVSIMAYADAELIYLEKAEIESFFNYNMETQKFGREIAEQLMVSNQKALFSLLYDTAEERYHSIIKQHSELFQLFPLKDIANCIGVTPETISRIRKKILHS